MPGPLNRLAIFLPEFVEATDPIIGLLHLEIMLSIVLPGCLPSMIQTHLVHTVR